MPPVTAELPPVTVAARDFLYIAPEILLTGWGLVLLLVDLVLLRRSTEVNRRRVLGKLGLVGIATAFVLMLLIKANSAALTDAGWLYDDPDPVLFFGTMSGDVLTSWMNLVLVALLGLVVGLSMVWEFTDHWGEYFALMFWATVGMMLLIASDELLTLFLTLEAMTLCLYLLTAIEKGRGRSAEAGLKYFVYGSVSSAVFLFGLSLVYGLTGTTRLDMAWRVLSEMTGQRTGLSGNLAGATATLLILAGFGFKLAVFPFHQWAPDVYEGAPAPVGAWIASGSKIAGFVALMKVFNWALGPWAVHGIEPASPGWVGLLAVLAAVTMTYGNLAALAQRNLKRMLAYSAVAHTGYILLGVIAVSMRPSNDDAAGAVLFYLVTYGFTMLGAFSMAAWLARDGGVDDIDDLRGLGAATPGLAACFALLMLSLIGVPPLAGFFGKLTLFLEALDSGEPGRPGLTWLVAVALANTVISAFYYARVLKAMFLRERGERLRLLEPSMAIRLPILLSTAVVLGFGLRPAPLLETMRGAALPMLATSGTVAAIDVPPPLPYEGPDPEEEELRNSPLIPEGASR